MTPMETFVERVAAMQAAITKLAAVVDAATEGEVTRTAHAMLADAREDVMDAASAVGAARAAALILLGRDLRDD